MLQGCCTALITPFKKNGSIDYLLYKKQISRQINAGVSGILSCGTTGEAPALSEDELGKNIKTAVNAAKGKVYVVAGTGTNNTNNTIRRTKYAESVGADYALIITPYYNKPNQTGLYKHFKQVANNTKMDIIIYNVPSRTSVSINPDTVAALSKIKNIVAIKEASGSINQATEILIKAKKGFIIMSGDDALTLPLMSIGASGVISTTSNLAPSYMQSLFELYFANAIPEAKKMHKFLYPIIKAMFIETNPIPLK
ncbi:4-hydroxy-tetrahydrodipicolinate synthase, partial [candidate division WOR-3 bacterium]|nr:4-hydroxy-tetrahydrodipicolinate synthase [candidate division WOR-3 bacterium]